MNILKIREAVEVAYKIINQLYGFVDYADDIEELPESIKKILPVVKQSLSVLKGILTVAAKLFKIEIEEEITTLGVSFDAEKLQELNDRLKKLSSYE